MVTTANLSTCLLKSSLQQIIERYEVARDVRVPNHDNRQQELYIEMNKLRQLLHESELGMRRLLGEDLAGARIKDLDQLELQLQASADKIRARKNELIQQQLDNLLKKDKMLEEENCSIYQWLTGGHGHQESTSYNQKAIEPHVAGTSVMIMEHPFPVFGGSTSAEAEDMGSMLQLSMLGSSHDHRFYDPYNHPSLRDPSLHRRGGF
ncbi:hypothetical protein Droror1_Dr00003660 [Drosera rotundifolia]